MIKYDYPTREIDISELIKYLLKNLLWIILGALIIGSAFLVVQSGKGTNISTESSLYTAKSMIYVQDDMENMPNQEGVAMDYTGIMSSNDVIQSVITECDLNMTYNEFISKLSSYTHGVGYEIITIQYNYFDADAAKEIVNAYTNKCVEKIKEVTGNNNVTIIDQAYVNEQMSESEKATLSTGVQNTGDTVILQTSLSKYIIIGAFGGLVLMCGVFALIYILDSSIKNKMEAERYLQLPVIGIVRDETGKQGILKCYYRYKRRFH